MSSAATVLGTMGFWPSKTGDITNHAPRDYDMRLDPGGYAPYGLDACEVEIADARTALGLEFAQTGFQLVDRASTVTDFYDPAQVVETYYEECKNLAMTLTGAHAAFTFDHLIREPGRQISGGGTDGSTQITAAEAGGGYVSAVHMDYTERTTWAEYLEVHGKQAPKAKRIIALNFWRPLVDVVLDQPLAVCDASTVQAEDLFETVVYGYGAETYSWHNIGIETYNVKSSPRHRWYYYPEMRSSEVLVFKSFDSAGVVGRACPHASFELGEGGTDPRRSIELRVLCFV